MVIEISLYDSEEDIIVTTPTKPSTDEKQRRVDLRDVPQVTPQLIEVEFD